MRLKLGRRLFNLLPLAQRTKTFTNGVVGLGLFAFLSARMFCCCHCFCCAPPPFSGRPRPGIGAIASARSTPAPRSDRARVRPTPPPTPSLLVMITDSGTLSIPGQVCLLSRYSLVYSHVLLAYRDRRRAALYSFRARRRLRPRSRASLENPWFPI